MHAEMSSASVQLSIVEGSAVGVGTSLYQRNKNYLMSTRFLLLLSILFLGFAASAQNRTLTGVVVEKGSDIPVEFATVKLLDASTNSMIGGTSTDLDGRFELEAPETPVTLAISFIGFAERRFENITSNDLGNLEIYPDGELLEEVVVTGERSSTEFKLDRRVFNVGKDLSNSGASALEVLNNVPSVTVNIEGEVALRGSSGVQILIDGKPSVLASDGLGTITAEMIERVEVVTNPSAKYAAEGTSGIINIVLKKENERGLNGSVTVNTGVPDNHSVGISVNQRTGKFNLFGQAGIGNRTRPTDSRSLNQNLLRGTEVASQGRSERNETFYNLILGADYHISDRSVLSLTGFYAFEAETETSTTDFEVFDADGILTNAWNRDELTEAGNPKWQYELNFKHEFDEDDSDHTLIISALGNSFSKDQSSEFTTINSEGVALFGDQLTRTDFGQTDYTFKLDYTRPISEALTTEFGVQYELNDVGNDFEVQDFEGGEFFTVPELTNRFEFVQGVLGAYATGAYEWEKWGVKGGLRYEYTDLNTTLVNTNERNDQKYPNFFPSLHTSYKLSEAASIQAGYSRRISRPRLWNLNPFFNVRDNFNIRAGNPMLQPEFTDSYEATMILTKGKVSMSSSLYYRYTTDVVERVSFVEDNINITKPVNLGTSKTNGLEINGKYRATAWLTLTGDANYSIFSREATLEDVSYDFTADQLSGRIVSKWDLPMDFDVEVSGNYQSAVQTVQGMRSGFTFADLGIRKKMLKGRLIVNASVRDVFASRIFESIASQPDFYVYSFRQRGRFVTLGISYGFGKGDAMEFSGARRR